MFSLSPLYPNISPPCAPKGSGQGAEFQKKFCRREPQGSKFVAWFDVQRLGSFVWPFSPAVLSPATLSRNRRSRPKGGTDGEFFGFACKIRRVKRRKKNMPNCPTGNFVNLRVSLVETCRMVRIRQNVSRVSLPDSCRRLEVCHMVRVLFHILVSLFHTFIQSPTPRPLLRPRSRGLLAAARSRSCSNSPPDCYSLRSRRFATLPYCVPQIRTGCK